LLFRVLEVMARIGTDISYDGGVVVGGPKTPAASQPIALRKFCEKF